MASPDHAPERGSLRPRLRTRMLLAAGACALAAPVALAGVTTSATPASASSAGTNAVVGFGSASPLSAYESGAPVVGLAATPDGHGFWTAHSDGSVSTGGDAASHGSLAGVPLNQPLVGMAATSDGGGYWLVASDGGIFSFGDARFFGSTGSMVLNQPVVGMAATSDGGGYWLVASDGGIFSFGDARFFGSTGSMVLNQPVVGMAATSDGGGYWLVASDGGIFSFGDARFFGSTGNLTLAAPVTGMTRTSDGGGYWMVGADGGVFSFGDATFAGSDPGASFNTPAVAMASTPGGYLVAYGQLASPDTALGQEQLLADFGYLPLSFNGRSFSWRWATTPAGLKALWSPAQPNLVLQGSIMTFEAQVGLPIDGRIGPSEIAALEAGVANPSSVTNQGGFTYVTVSERNPETLTLFHNGGFVSTPVNTGGAGTPTALGNFTVYLRLRNQVMSGTTPSGAHYADPVQYVSYFNGGDAIHYMPRVSYGDPQSLGCVELPLAPAAAIWPLTNYGTIVSVI